MSFSKYIELYKDNVNVKLNKNDILTIWQNIFLDGISKEALSEAYIEDFLWHACSYDLIPYIEGNQAKKKFDSLEKDGIIIFYQEKDICYEVTNASDLKSSDLRNEFDIYIVDKNFTWTYVNTHEKMIGPYFIEKK